MIHLIRKIRQLEKPFPPRIEEKYRAGRWRIDLIICLIWVGLMTLTNLAKFYTDHILQIAYLRQHALTSLMLVRALSLSRSGFILISVLFVVWLFKMLTKAKPNFKKYDLYYFLWLISLAIITSFNNISNPSWYFGILASQIPVLFIYYLIIPQHNFWLRVIPNLLFTVLQFILYASSNTPPPLFGYSSIYASYIMSNIIGIIFSHRLYMNERRNFMLHRKKDRLTAMLVADKQKLQMEKELVAHYEAELRKEEVQREKLKALQAQIKPHFLSNILSTVAYYCRTDADQAYQLVNDLAVYFQSTFQLQSETIPYKDELKLVRDYLSIESARMEERLYFSIEETGDLDECRLPPFTLQPLVENAIRHGLAPLPDGGTLTIAAREMPDHYYFEVRDDGRGFDPTEKPGGLHSEYKTSGGIGLSNIQERLHGLYGCGLKIDSRPGTGTTVSFCIPKQKG